MADADLSVKKNAATGGGDDDGIIAAFTRKRHSFFTRPDPMSSLGKDNPAPTPTAPTTLTFSSSSSSSSSTPPIQSLPYHQLAERPVNAGQDDSKNTDSSDSRRRSLFTGPWKLLKRDGNTQHARGQSLSQAQTQSSLDHTQKQKPPRPPPEEDYDTEHAFYNHYQPRPSFSMSQRPQQLAQTRSKPSTALATVHEKDSSKKLPAASKHHASESRVHGIKEGGILSTLGVNHPPKVFSNVNRGTPKHTEPTPTLLDRQTETRPVTSREDITALPVASSQPTAPPSRHRRDDLTNLLGFKEKSTVQPAPSHSPTNSLQPPTRPKREKSPSNSTERSASSESARPASKSRKEELGSLLGFKEKSSHQAHPSDSSNHSRPSTDRTRRPSLEKFSRPSLDRQRPSPDPNKKSEIHALLGISEPQERKPRRQAPPRPKREDEESESKSMRTEITPSFQPPQNPPPERPKRDSHDVQVLKDMGFGQLLYRTESNTSTKTSNAEDSKPRTSMDAETAAIGEAPMYPMIGVTFGALADDVESVPHRYQQLKYRAKQPLPALPTSAGVSSLESRSPLQPVSEVEESPEYVPTPTEPAVSPISPVSPLSPTPLSPKSPTSLHSAQRSLPPLAPTRSTPELTGPSIPDDEAWEDEIDFLYRQEAESTSDFDWDRVGTDPQLAAQREEIKRLSLMIPSSTGPAMMANRLPKKLSEGSLRALHSKYPSQNALNPHQIGHRGFLHARKSFAPSDGRIDEDATIDARAWPEVRVVDYDDKQTEPPFLTGAVQMHGYESVAAGYLSDPESAQSLRSQHRKSSSYSSYESIARRSLNAKEPGRSSNASISSVPDLMHSSRRSKASVPSTSSYSGGTLETLPQSPLSDSPLASNSNSGFAQQADVSPISDYMSTRRPDILGDIPPLRPAGRVAKAADPRRYSRLIQHPPEFTVAQESRAGWI